MIEARFEGRLGAFRLKAEFAAPSQGITGLFGPSGSGKTTVLRCLAGLTRMAGSLRVGEEVWQEGKRFVAPHHRGAAYVFQDADLFAHLSVRENLEYGAKRTRTTSPRGRGRGPNREAVGEGEGLRSIRTTSQHRYPSPSHASRGSLPLPLGEVVLTGFDEVVELLNLGSLLGRTTHRLSGGERQRVAIGRALLSQPRLLLLDEPLAGLDAMAKAEILPYLERLHAAVRIPIVYVSHDLAEIARLADHLIVMKDGVVVTSGPCKAAASADAGPLTDLSPDVVTGLALAALLAGLAPVKLK